jgi:hypothetical protein
VANTDFEGGCDGRGRGVRYVLFGQIGPSQPHRAPLYNRSRKHGALGAIVALACPLPGISPAYPQSTCAVCTVRIYQLPALPMLMPRTNSIIYWHNTHGITETAVMIDNNNGCISDPGLYNLRSSTVNSSVLLLSRCALHLAHHGHRQIGLVPQIQQ